MHTKNLLERRRSVKAGMPDDQLPAMADAIIQGREGRLDKRMRRIVCRQQARTRGLQDDARGCSNDPAGRIDRQVIDRSLVQMNLKIDPPITCYRDWSSALK